MPVPFSFMDVTVPVTTTATSVYTLLRTYFAANRTGDLTVSGNLKHETWSSIQFTADYNNSGVVFVGDSTVASGTPPTQQGTPLQATTNTTGFFASSGMDVKSIDLNLVYAVASTGTQYLHVRAQR